MIPSRHAETRLPDGSVVDIRGRSQNTRLNNRQKWPPYPGRNVMKTSRRTLLKNSAAAAAALSLDWRYASAQAETVRIGVIFDHSGPFAAGGSVACAVGAQIAIDLCNERGGVGGQYKVA